jgi:hypothetical protein
MAICNVDPRTTSEDADLNLGEAPDNAEANERSYDDEDDSEDEDFQDPSPSLLNPNDEDEDKIHQVFKAILEPLHKDIQKINKHLTTQKRKLVSRLASIETKHQIALNTIATLK